MRPIPVSSDDASHGASSNVFSSVPTRAGKRIGFVRDQFPNLSETFVMDQMRGLLKAGFDVRMYAQQNVIDKIKHSIPIDLMAETYFAGQRSFQWVRPRRVRYMLEKIANRRSMQRLLSSAINDCDLMLCHFGPMGLQTVQASLQAKKDTKIWTVFHGYDVSSYIATHGDDVYKELFARGDQFLAISDFWARRLVTLGCPADKIVVLHMGVDVGAIGYNPKPIVVGRPRRLLYVGRLVPKKGADVLLRALADYRMNSPETRWELSLIGDGPMKRDLEALVIELNLDDCVVFCGPQPSEQVRRMLDAADYFVLPSLTPTDGDMEGIPVALMEAMAAGLPVISTVHGGIPELVEHGISGLLAVEADVKSLRDRLGEAFAQTTEQRQAMQLAARSKVENEFDQGALLSELVAMIDPTRCLEPTHAIDYGDTIFAPKLRNHLRVERRQTDIG